MLTRIIKCAVVGIVEFGMLAAAIGGITCVFNIIEIDVLIAVIEYIAMAIVYSVAIVLFAIWCSKWYILSAVFIILAMIEIIDTLEHSTGE